MKNSPHFLVRAARRFRRGIVFAGLAAGLPLAAWAQSNSVAVAGSFVQELQFPNTGHTVDTRVDNSVGTTKSGITYVLAADYSANTYLRKFDPSGAEAIFANGGNQVVISGIAGAAMAVVPGTTNLFIAGGSKIFRVSTENGQIINSTDAGSGVDFKGVFWDGTNVVACGNFSGGTRTVLGRTATARGNQAGILMKLSKDLSSNLGLITLGANGSGAINTANSVVVDENNDIYIAGKIGNGTFNSDIFNAGLWSVTKKSGGTVNSLSDANALLNNSGVSGTQTTVATINDTAPGGNYVFHATGTFVASASGNYTFYNITDDGSWLYVDGNPVIYDDTSHGTATKSGTVSLSLGLHSIDWLYFNGGGPGNGRFQYTGPGVSSQTDVPAADIGSNKGYVLKFKGDLTALKGVYSSQQSTGQGSEVKELTYSQGFVYGVGYWTGNADNPGISPVDASTAGSQDVEIVKLDTGLLLKARATVKGVANNTGYSITVDDSGNAYLTGSEGAASVDFFGNGDPTNHPFTSISSAKASIFIAQLDSNFTFKWVNTPTTPVPDFDFSIATPRVRWNSALQRVFWMGYFTSGQLLMGNPNTMQTLNGPEGFIAVLDPTGKYAERVLLTILSDYGDSGTQVKPFGGPSGGSNNIVVVGVNTKPVIKGAQVNASVPSYIYWDLTDTDITSLCLANPSLIDTLAETRIGCIGYSVGDSVANGVANSYTFTISQDTIVRFNWTVEHALRVRSDFSETEGHDPGAIGHIVGLKSDAAGSPEPSVQKHWVTENTPVIAAVDAAVDDQTYLAQGLSVRYVATGYDAYGPANTLGSPGSTNFVAFVGNDARRQVPQFLMTGPASITYHWKLKIGVQVSTTGLKSASYPYIHVISDPGQVTPPTQADSIGSGTFFYDEGTSLQIGTIRSQDTTQLKGWFNGDGTVFPNTGALADLVGTFTATVSGVTQTYASQPVANFNRPARVMWDYGDRIFDETVFIGGTVTFSTVDDPAVRAKLHTDLPPALVTVLDSPQGSTSSDMALWDTVGKKYYPLRPGMLMSYWTTTADPNDRVIIRLTFKYPVVPHYRHIANTRPVPMDPSTNDAVSFVGLKYTETTTGAAVDSSGNFLATGPGMSVLQFTETSSSGRGGSVTTPRIRVVQTKNWNDNLPNTQNAVIGKKITSSFDTAGLGTGYLFFPKARYNTAIYDRANLSGPIIPVNLNPTAGADEQLVVVWYENRDKILWPYQAVRYQPAWPVNAAEGLNRIVIASRYGNESVAQDGTDQVVVPAETYGTNTYPAETSLNPARFQQVQIYNQPNRALAGYNPNEEHALLAPSLRSAAIAPQPMAVYALRNGDLNVTNRDSTYTSDPYVLVQFYDSIAQEPRMAVYNIVTTASNLNAGELSYNYKFEQEMEAGEPVIPFYPLVQVIGATPSSSTYGKDGQPAQQICFWKDHKGTPWAVSGDSFFNVYFYYPLAPDFYWPASDNKQPGDSVAFLPTTPRFAGKSFNIDYTRNDQTPAAQGIKYTTVWPLDVPILKVGETLTFPGGEYQLDHPTTTTLNEDGDFVDSPTPGLPGVVGFAAGQVVYDTMNPTMDDQKNFDTYTARIFPALEERTVPLSVADFPTTLLPVNKRTTVKNGVYIFNELPSSLQKRMFYDPIRGVIGIKGFLNDKDISDSTLTASPPAVYVLEPDILTSAEKAVLDGSAATSPFKDVQGSKFTTAMDNLFNLTRNPNLLDKNKDGVDTAYRVGLEQKVKVNPANGKPLLTTNGTIITAQRDSSKAAAMQALGPGLAMVANPNFLDPNNTVQISYVTLAENNSDALGSAPVALHIVKVDKTERYRGSIKTILSANVFDENIVLRHTADFGANADDLVFEWWYRPEDGTEALPPDRQPLPTPWKLFADPSGNLGLGFYQLTLKGNPSAPQVLLGDTLFFVRYRHKNEVHDGVNWEVPQPNGERREVLGNFTPGIPYDWAGAGNSSPQDIDGDGQPDYKAQLAEGWVKRVLSAVNPYEARIRDFSQNAPATYSSIIQQLGAPYSGPVALNSDQNVIENVGLIALYMTILNRAEDLSINLSTPITDPVIANALELASTRISDFYLLLGNEAYSDSQNPAIGFGSSSVEYGNMAPTVFAFQNQLASRLDEELGLLRGVNANNGTPVFNRLYWNFTHAEGEAAYAMKYNITDINRDGFIDVNDAMTLFPQGHGDAWGHYLTSIRMQYDLLRHPYFNWVSRSEFINSQDVVIPVDYLDERKFAQVAAAKAQAGAQILSMTYRSKFVADPRGQWQGYLDTDPKLAWGVDEWARRAGQGAFFDWVTANALLPSVHPNTNYTGIQKVDRTTVSDISTISGNFVAIQQTMDQIDHGDNPLGLHNGALSFAIDPAFTTSGDAGQGKFFDQIFAKALTALNNAKSAFDNANMYNNLIRQVANTEADYRNEVYDQDISYRNQLIEIFGSPYPGTIGSGKLYPAGYQGPDIALYSYVKVNSVNDSTVPQPSQAFLADFKDQTTGSSANLVKGWGLTLPIPSDWKNKFNLTLLNGTVGSVNYTDFASNSIPTNQMLQNLNLPVMANGYSYVAPPEWGERASVGELQKTIGDMVQAQADLNHEIFVWQQIQTDIINKLKFLNQKFEWDSNIKSIQMAKDVFDVAQEIIKATLEEAAEAVEKAGEVAKDATAAGSDMVPTMLPEGGLAISPGDALAPARGGIEMGGVAASAATGFSAEALKAAAKISDVVKLVADQSFDFGMDVYTKREELLPELQDLQTKIKEEDDQRVAVFKAVQVLTSAGNDYRTILANGVRLQQERSTFNKRVASQTQQNRYEDITFRFSRNQALEQYRSAFDLASRYAYLAASAYDYDLNLGPDDPGSPLQIMSDIVRQRTIGFVDGNGNPQVGEKGLAEDLAKLRDNYDILGSRMGLVNPILETESFSLRTESFRLLSDTNSDGDWAQALLSPTIYTTNLWNVPEFRRYCRSFAPESSGPQPGLVIPLTTQIRSGQNFFGWPLGAGDASYDASVYATRIASIGVAFAGYDSSSMARTPRVYLIPAGADVMTIPNTPNHDLRFWSVLDQVIPLPYPATTANFSNPTWKPIVDSVTSGSGTFGDIRQYSSFLASGFDNPDPSAIDPETLNYDTRLIGRSVWNTKWLLIIPGASLSADPAAGLNSFINSVKDIQLSIKTYGYSGN